MGTTSGKYQRYRQQSLRKCVKWRSNRLTGTSPSGVYTVTTTMTESTPTTDGPSLSFELFCSIRTNEQYNILQQPIP